MSETFRIYSLVRSNNNKIVLKCDFIWNRGINIIDMHLKISLSIPGANFGVKKIRLNKNMNYICQSIFCLFIRSTVLVNKERPFCTCLTNILLR